MARWGGWFESGRHEGMDGWSMGRRGAELPSFYAGGRSMNEERRLAKLFGLLEFQSGQIKWWGPATRRAERRATDQG